MGSATLNPVYASTQLGGQRGRRNEQHPEIIARGNADWAAKQARGPGSRDYPILLITRVITSCRLLRDGFPEGHGFQAPAQPNQVPRVKGACCTAPGLTSLDRDEARLA